MTDVATTSTEGAHDAVHDHEQGRHSSLGLSNKKLAMWLFLGSEYLLFGALISTYLLSKANFIGGLVAGNSNLLETLPPELVDDFIADDSVGALFNIPFTSVNSLILLTSSLTMVFAHKAVSEGDYKNTRVWLTATAALGCTFIAGQVHEFTVFYREGLGYTGNLFGSAFYTLIGLHGFHVVIGILMLATLLILASRDKLRQDRAETVELVGLFWHFINIVWVLIFAIVYLIP
ncbi:MAG: heme-copper oxidase subunit III [Actinomycetia bacterium]|nr:heme-copper oxidase subunit III [Actinomycetes bacterium]